MNEPESSVPSFRQICGWSFVLFFAALLFTVPGFLLPELPERDVLMRYAPMAESFARGDWQFAFHPRIPFFHSSFAGLIVFLTGCSGFSAVCATSAFVFALGVFPLLLLLRRLSPDRRILLTGGFLYILCGPLLRLAFSGMRDSTKTLALILLAYGVILVWQERTRIGGYLVAGFAIGFGAWIRADMILFGGAVLLLLGTLDARKNRHPVRSLCGFGLFLAMMTVPSMINYCLVHVPMPELRYGMMLQRMIGRMPGPVLAAFCMAVALPIFFAAVLLLSKISRNKKLSWGFGTLGVLLIAGCVVLSGIKAIFFVWSGKMITDFLLTSLKGTFLPYAVPAVLYLAIRIRTKRFSGEDALLAGLFLGHYVLLSLQILVFNHQPYLSERYLTPAIVFELFWAAAGLVTAWDFLRARLPGRTKLCNGLAWSFCLIAGGLLLYYSVANSIRLMTSSKRKAAYRCVLEVANAIRNDYRGPGHDKTSPSLHSYDYVPNLSPAVYFGTEEVVYFDRGEQKTAIRNYAGALIVSAYLAGGRAAGNAEEAVYLVEPVTRPIPWPEDRVRRSLGIFSGRGDAVQVWRLEP